METNTVSALICTEIAWAVNTSRYFFPSANLDFQFDCIPWYFFCFMSFLIFFCFVLFCAIAFMLVATACLNKFAYISIGLAWLWLGFGSVWWCVYHFGKCSSLHGHRPMSRAISRKMLSFCWNNQHTWVHIKRFCVLLLANRVNVTASKRSQMKWLRLFSPEFIPQTTQTQQDIRWPSTDIVDVCLRTLCALLFLCQPFFYSQNEITAWANQRQHFDYLPFFSIRCLFVVFVLFVLSVAVCIHLPANRCDYSNLRFSVCFCTWKCQWTFFLIAIFFLFVRPLK